MINLLTKFEVSAITCNEDIKGNAKKCKNSCFDPPFGDFGVMHRVHLWIDGKRVLDFLLRIIELSSSFHGCGTIKRNLSKSAFSEVVGHFEHNC